jgi:hypothetical protein
MSDKKEVTIGITINLENYENLRLEVEGKVESQQDADDLITFLDGMLARLGRGDAATADRIDAYRRRVLTTKIEPSQPEERASRTASEPEKKQIAPEVAAESASPAVKGEKTLQVQEECPTEIIEEAIPAAPKQPHPPVHPKPPEQKRETSPTPEPAAKQAATESKPPEAEAVCEACGAPITKSQAKLAQLFTSRTLCKKCMEQP